MSRLENSLLFVQLEPPFFHQVLVEFEFFRSKLMILFDEFELKSCDLLIIIRRKSRNR